MGSAAGKLVFHVFAALAEFERNLIRERTRAGLVAVRACGRAGGREPKLSEPQIKRSTRWWMRKFPMGRIAELYGVSRTTIYNGCTNQAA
ncbi:recombinase family protein [Chromobacterium violaceum]|nr:recombinase family protein [Chromobacterium violaceum]